MEQRKDNEATRQQSDVEKNMNPEQGRVVGSDQKTDAEGTADISQMDQQEGQMNHGELGGNFNNAGSVKGV